MMADARGELDESLRALIQGLPVAVLVWSGGTIQYANQAYATLLGYEHPGQLLGARVLDVLSKHLDSDNLATIERRVRSGSSDAPDPGPTRVPFTRLDGAARTSVVRAFRVLFQGVHANVSVVHDVTEQEQMRAQ